MNHKYNAKKTVFKGHGFRSKLEASVYQMLLLLEIAGKIKDIRREQSIELLPNMKHKIDFIVYDLEKDTDVLIEAKGFEDATWIEKKKIYKLFSPLPLQIWKKGKYSYSYPSCVEEIPVGKYKVVEK